MTAATRSPRSELRAEELVYLVADELGLTELELHGVGSIMADLVDGMLVGLRIDLKKATGRTLTIEDYLLRDPSKVIDLAEALTRLGERVTHGRPPA